MTASLGLLVPRSGLYPTIAFDLQAGLQAGLAERSASISTTVENIGFGEKENEIYAQCEKLLLQGVKIIAAYINAPVATHLQPLFEASGALLVVLDSGYHFPVHEGRLANVIFLSLQGSLCCRMAAATAARDTDGALAFIASYYDAGYRAPYAMTQATAEAGKNIAFHHITALKRVEFDLTPLQSWVQATSEPVVLAAFCGDMSADFLLHISRFSKRPAALYAGPYMAEETWLSRSAYPGLDFKACVPWDRTLSLPANERFSVQLKTRKPTIFSLLGYEAGLLAAAALESSLEGQEAILALAEQPLESPRGALRIDAATFQTIAPVYEVTVGQDAASGHCRISGPVRERSDASAQWTALQSDMASLRGNATSNWLNAYPCIA